ncbi:type I-D CRISPR-associated protein Cas7/Csc2 [Oxyplasma meridianum]|uniref:Type I-D CRISPR-associated protein Cas7/Csc2 n=1 Tax=Oxyplasma meridianum TaxID=3073602 RepID=A0AAX4NEI0_9ARCH
MSEELREYIYSKIGENSFATKEEDGIPAMAQNKRRVVTIYVLRETIAPMIDRSDDPESSVSLVMPTEDGEIEVIEVPARKFKSKEKLMGLKLCRTFKVIDAGYEYNSVSSISYLGNPNSVIFGDSVVEGGDAGQAMLPSRVLYSSSYSIRSRSEITKQLTHNSLSESGTMWDRRNEENRTSLFNTEYIIPGVYFPSFITMINPTPESLIHMMLCLKQRSYGAQTSITGPNIKNNIVCIYSGEVELPITSFTVSKNSHPKVKWEQDQEKFKDSVNKFVVESMLEEHTGRLTFGHDIEDFNMRIDNLSASELQAVYDRLKSDSQELVKYAKITPKDRKKKATSKSEELKSAEDSDESV